MRTLLRTSILWTAALALLGIGMACVFGAVLVPGLFLPGVVLIDAGLLGVVAAALLAVAAARRPAAP